MKIQILLISYLLGALAVLTGCATAGNPPPNPVVYTSPVSTVYPEPAQYSEPTNTVVTTKTTTTHLPIKHSTYGG